MRREVRALSAKAIDSLILGIDHFNCPFDQGRVEATLILLDRSFELLLKAIIVHKGGRIREPKEKMTIGFSKCLQKCISDAKIKCVSDEEAITIQTLNALRDAAQHYLVDVSEEYLYIYSQAAITLFEKLISKELKIALRDRMPNRVLPVCTQRPKDIVEIFDAQFSDIKEMLAPKARQQLEARAKLRSLAILQDSLDGKLSQPNDKDLDVIVRRIRKGEHWTTIFPGVASLKIDPEADGIGISIRLTKKQGESVQIVPQNSQGATAIVLKTVNELDRYSLYQKDLKAKLGLNQHQVRQMVARYELRNNLDYYKEFTMGCQVHKRFTKKALDLLCEKKQEYLDSIKPKQQAKM